MSAQADGNSGQGITATGKAKRKSHGTSQRIGLGKLIHTLGVLTAALHSNSCGNSYSTAAPRGSTTSDAVGSCIAGSSRTANESSSSSGTASYEASCTAPESIHQGSEQKETGSGMGTIRPQGTVERVLSGAWHCNAQQDAEGGVDSSDRAIWQDTNTCAGGRNTGDEGKSITTTSTGEHQSSRTSGVSVCDTVSAGKRSSSSQCYSTTTGTKVCGQETSGRPERTLLHGDERSGYATRDTTLPYGHASTLSQMRIGDGGQAEQAESDMVLRMSALSKVRWDSELSGRLESSEGSRIGSSRPSSLKENLDEAEVWLADSSNLTHGVHKKLRKATKKAWQNLRPFLDLQCFDTFQVKQQGCKPLKLLQIFAGECTLTKCGIHRNWTVLEPVELKLGTDLTQQNEQQRILEVIARTKPDLVSLEPPCGPWSTLQNISIADVRNDRDLWDLRLLRAEHLTFWKFCRQVWESVNSYDGTVLLEQPEKAESWMLSYNINKPN